MSDTKNNAKPQKTLHKAFKWSVLVLGILALEAGGIAAAVKLSELKNASEVDKLQNIYAELNKQQSRLSVLEKIPASVVENSRQISSNFNMLTSLSEHFNLLKSEVGNNKLAALNQKMEAFDQRIESIEESKSSEALVLSLALIIKENALYHRPFAKETDILRDLSSDNPTISEDVSVIDRLKNISIPDSYELVEQYNRVVETFSFDIPQTAEKPQNSPEEKSTMAKSIRLIKDTVAGINFDKVVVIKKDTRTDEQKMLMQMLGDFVKNHNFADAIAYIEANPEFNNVPNQDFTNWKNQAREKIEFDRAISNIISSQLKALRQEINSGTIDAPKPQNKDIVTINESNSND